MPILENDFTMRYFSSRMLFNLANPAVYLRKRFSGFHIEKRFFDFLVFINPSV
jgi:hypothetical protein